jgi:diguanylate cyclase (GGDEF)-like protein
MVVILLVLGIASFAFPGLLSQQPDSEFYRLNLGLAVRGLVGLVLLFAIYVIYQQLQIRRIDLEVFDALGQIQDRAEKANKLAGRDSLTNLYNREFGEQRLHAEMSRSRRKTRRLSVLRLNLEGIDKIDAQLGSASADCATRLFTEHLQKELRGSDVPIRLDRTEFLIVLPECGADEAEIVVNRLDRMVLEFGEHQLDIVAGWADYVDGDVLQTLVMRAESTLHQNKRSEDGTTQPVKILVSFGGDKKASERLAKLTGRERQVFELLVQGKSNKEVADVLDLGVRTVDTHRKNLMARLQVHSVTELILLAVSERIIDVK